MDELLVHFIGFAIEAALELLPALIELPLLLWENCGKGGQNGR